MEFLYPNFLFAIPAFLILIIIKKIFLRRSSSIQVSNFNSLKNYFGNQGKLKISIINVLFIISITLLIIGLARPRISLVDENITVEVIDIILVLDTSSSMLAEDFKPNRLEAVKDAAQEFIANRNGDRIGLLVFGKETFIQCPLTIDYSVLNSLLNEVTVMEPKYDGTAIGVAIASGVNRLRNSDSESKVIILLSDGSNNAGSIDPISAAKIAKEYGIKVYTIGAGTNQSITQIPGRGFVRNEIDEETLIGIADVTNAKYFRAIDKASLSGIYSEIDKLEKSEISVSYFSSFEEVYIWFILLGFVFIILSELLRTYYFRRVL
ncbi:MAG: aerotolerance regulator BatA [Candidatus Marinimicrobia bacterium]|nr:aerotolerance regulator BatA [Candidatus Neomarinimicrobiota bacterium]|tara:strand:- start:888 stop:1853 length:966 start_codon:yes stop_codon:yes gene_type:complete